MLNVILLASTQPRVGKSTLTKALLKEIPNSTATASEDFAIIAEKIPTTYMILTAGFMDERGDYPLHHPKAQFDENVCVIGAACFSYCASHWLENHKNRT